MKTIEKLRSHNFAMIPPDVQKLLLGGVTDEIIDGGYLGEVEVVAKRLFDPSKYKWDIVKFDDIGVCNLSYFGGAGTYKISPYSCPDGPGVKNDQANLKKILESNDTKTPTASKNITQVMQLASDILTNQNITLANKHYSKVEDKATPIQNVMDASKGLLAHNSSYEKAPGLMTPLSPDLLTGIMTLAQSNTISISEIAGGSHSYGSSHYDGNAIDINWVNDSHVSTMSKSQIDAFRKEAFDAGATAVYDPWHDPDGSHTNHIHIEW